MLIMDGKKVFNLKMVLKTFNKGGGKKERYLSL